MLTPKLIKIFKRKWEGHLKKIYDTMCHYAIKDILSIDDRNCLYKQNNICGQNFGRSRWFCHPLIYSENQSFQQ